jgi:hypothetical protein
MDDDRPEPHRLDATGDGDADAVEGRPQGGGQELSLSRARSHVMEAPLEYLER